MSLAIIKIHGFYWKAFSRNANHLCNSQNPTFSDIILSTSMDRRVICPKIKPCLQGISLDVDQGWPHHLYFVKTIVAFGICEYCLCWYCCCGGLTTFQVMLFASWFESGTLGPSRDWITFICPLLTNFWRWGVKDMHGGALFKIIRGFFLSLPLWTSFF